MRIRTTFSAAAIVCAAGLAQGQTIALSVFENGDNISIQGLDIELEIIDLGSQIEMVMHNNSTLDSRITTIYFEMTEFSSEALSSPIIVNNADAMYTDDKFAPRSPAGSIRDSGGLWGGTMYGLKPETPQPNVNSLSPGEAVSVIFDLNNGYSALDVFKAINSTPSDFRVAVHIQSVGEFGASVWAVNPTPGTAALMGVAGLFASRRRRAA